MESVILQSSDGVCYTLPAEVAKLSSIVRDVLEHCTAEGNVTIPLPKVSNTSLSHLVEWMHRKKQVSSQTPNEAFQCEQISECDYIGRDSELSNWERLFFHHLDKDVLFIMLNAANYMGITALVDAGSSYIAEVISDMTLEEAKMYLNVTINIKKSNKKRGL